MPYIQNEWQAVKDKFDGLYVMDGTSKKRKVAVRFGVPESEVASITYPLVVIDPSAPVIDHTREHRGWVNIPYTPEGITPNSAFDPSVDVNSSPFWMDYPVPVNFDFTVSVLCRTQRHMLQLMHRFQQMDMLPQRNAYIIEPITNTVRSLFVIGGPAYDGSRDNDNKRLFRMTYVIRVPGEMLATEFDQSFVALGFPVPPVIEVVTEVDVNSGDTGAGFIFAPNSNEFGETIDFTAVATDTPFDTSPFDTSVFD